MSGLCVWTRLWFRSPASIAAFGFAVVLTFNEYDYRPLGAGGDEVPA
jgi:hypothetical protein